MLLPFYLIPYHKEFTLRHHNRSVTIIPRIHQYQQKKKQATPSTSSGPESIPLSQPLRGALFPDRTSTKHLWTQSRCHSSPVQSNRFKSRTLKTLSHQQRALHKLLQLKGLHHRLAILCLIHPLKKRSPTTSKN